MLLQNDPRLSQFSIVFKGKRYPMPFYRVDRIKGKFYSFKFPDRPRELKLIKAFHNSALSGLYVKLTENNMSYSVNASRIVMNMWDAAKRVDYLDSDPTNISPLNLQAISNIIHKKSQSPISSQTGYRGVTHDRNGKFYANIRVAHKHTYSKQVETVIEAAAHRNIMAAQFHGMHAYFNKIDGYILTVEDKDDWRPTRGIYSLKFIRRN